MSERAFPTSKESDLTEQGEEAAWISEFNHAVKEGPYEVGDRALYEDMARKELSRMIGDRPAPSKDVELPFTPGVLYVDFDGVEWHRDPVIHPFTRELYIRHERTDENLDNILTSVYYLNAKTRGIELVGGDLFNILEVEHQKNILGQSGGERRSVRRSKRRTSKRRRSVRRSSRKRRRSKRTSKRRTSKRRRSFRRSSRKRRIRKNEKD